MLPSAFAPLVGLVALLATAAAEGGGGDGGPLLRCGSSSTADFDELSAAFKFARGVCCDQLSETCGPSAIGLPTTCASPICARAVALVNASCAALLVSPAFPVGIGFQPLLDGATAACAHTVGPLDEVRAQEAPRRARRAPPCAASIGTRRGRANIFLLLAAHRDHQPSGRQR